MLPLTLIIFKSLTFHLFNRSVNADDDAMFAAEESPLDLDLPIIPTEAEKANKAAIMLQSDALDPSPAGLESNSKIKKGAKGLLLSDMLSDDEGEGEGKGRGKGSKPTAQKELSKDPRVISTLLSQEVEVSSSHL